MKGNCLILIHFTASIVCVCSVSVGHVGNDFTWTRSHWTNDKVPMIVHDGFASALGKPIIDTDDIFVTSILGTLQHDTWSEIVQRKREEKVRWSTYINRFASPLR
jgi:hypothetical protein